VLVLFGIGAAAFAVLGGAFSTIGCVKSPPDWVYDVLLFAGILTLAAAAAPAVMLIRHVRAIRIVAVFALGAALSCGGYAAYMALLGNSC